MAEAVNPPPEPVRQSPTPDERATDERLQGDSQDMGRTDTLVELLRGFRPPSSLHVSQSFPTLAAPDQKLPPDISPPGYELLDVLGRGGQSIVYRAVQTSLARLVAVKIMLGGSHAGDEDRARFQREALAVAKLKHPQIVEIYDVRELDGHPYCILEYLPGGSLSSKLAGAPQAPVEAAALIEVLARTMHWAHQQGIVHRDLKPANVLLTADGQPKITDFGLARRIEDEEGLTHTGRVMGTPSYMAPEQARGLSKEIGPPADIYALGAMLYQVLTGRPPFLGTSSWEVIQQVLERDPVPPRKLQPKISPDLETICLKCLAKEPERRYPDANALAADLRRFVDGKPILARATPWREHAWRWARRKPAIASLLATLATVIVSALVALSLLYANAERERKNAVEQRKQAERNERGADEAAAFLRQISWYAAKSERPTDVLAAHLDALVPEDDFETVVDNIAQRVSTAFPDQPLREATVRHTLGLTYQNLLQHKKAAGQLAAAYRLRLQHRGPDHADTLDSQRFLADSYLELQKFDEAIDFLEKVSAAQVRTLGATNKATLLTQVHLADAYLQGGRLNEASASLERLLADCERTTGPDGGQKVSVQLLLAKVKWKQGKKVEAIPLWTQGYEGMRAALGPLDPGPIVVGDELAKALWELQRYEDIEPIHRAGYEYYAAKHGPHSYQAQSLRLDLAELLCMQNRATEGLDLAREAASTMAQEFPDHDPDLINIRARVGMMLVFHNQAADAETILRQAQAGLNLRELQTAPVKPLPAGNYWVATRAFLGRSLMLQKKFAEAEPLLVAGIRDFSAAREFPAHRQLLPAAQHWLQELSVRRQQEGTPDAD